MSPVRMQRRRSAGSLDNRLDVKSESRKTSMLHASTMSERARGALPPRHTPGGSGGAAMVGAGAAAESPPARAVSAAAAAAPQLASLSRLDSPKRRLGGFAVTREVLRIEKAETQATVRVAAKIGDVSQAADGDVDGHDIWHPASSSSDE